MDNRPEGLRPPLEPQKVKLGEWVRPLAGITATPDALRGHEVRTKIVPLDIEGQEVNMEMNAVGFDTIPLVRVIQPTGDEDMTGTQSRAWEERFGRQLFSVAMITADENDYPDGLPIAVFMRTAQGSVYRNEFISSEGEAAYVDMAKWKKQGDTKEDEVSAHFLLVPEIEAVLRNIEFKFDTIEDSK